MFVMTGNGGSEFQLNENEQEGHEVAEVSGEASGSEYHVDADRNAVIRSTQPDQFSEGTSFQLGGGAGKCGDEHFEENFILGDCAVQPFAQEETCGGGDDAFFAIGALGKQQAKMDGLRKQELVREKFVDGDNVVMVGKVDFKN